MFRFSVGKLVLSVVAVGMMGLAGITASASASVQFSFTSHADPTGVLHKAKPSPVELNLAATATPGPGENTVKPMAEVDFGLPHFSFDTSNIPRCTAISANNSNFPPDVARRLCPNSIVGSGTASIYLAGTVDFPISDGVVTVFAGAKDPKGHPTYVLHVYSESIHQGIFASATTGIEGLEVHIPRLTADSAVGSFGLTFSRSAFAQCPTGTWVTEGSAIFANRDSSGIYTNQEDLKAPSASETCVGVSPPAPRPPRGPVGVSINHGALFTNDPHVTLSVVWNGGDRKAVVDNDGGFRHSRTFKLARKLKWKLDTRGTDRFPRTVYLRFGDSEQTLTDNIILDQTAPHLSAVAATRTGGSEVTVTTEAGDRTSGVGKIQIGGRKSDRIEKVDYRNSVTIDSDHTKLWVRVIDRAGNASKWKAVYVG